MDGVRFMGVREDGWVSKELQRMVPVKFQGVDERFLEKSFVNDEANKQAAGPAFPLGDTTLIPRAKVLPPFGRSDQRIFADVGHLTATASYHIAVLLPCLLPWDT